VSLLSLSSSPAKKEERERERDRERRRKKQLLHKTNLVWCRLRTFLLRHAWRQKILLSRDPKKGERERERSEKRGKRARKGKKGGNESEDCKGGIFIFL
jgi:hypothetical protein